MTHGNAVVPTRPMPTEELAITVLSLRVSCTALLLALAAGLPVSLGLALSRVVGRGAILAIINAGMGLPPVLVGLVITFLLWRSSPFGGWDLLYTPEAMIIAQAVLALPIVVGLSVSAFVQLGPHVPEQLRGLGARGWRLGWLMLRQARLPLLAAVMAAIGRLLAEVGAVMMVGGNIKGETRVLTTAIVLETRRGNFDMALRLGFLLLSVTLIVNAALTWLQRRSQDTSVR